MNERRRPDPAEGGGPGAPRLFRSPLTRFVLAALAWLPVTFGAWYLLGPVLLWPVRLLVQLVARVGMGDLVQAIESGGPSLAFITSLRPGEGVGTGVVSVDVNMLVYAFGMPLFAALTIAAREAKWWRTLAIGYAVMVPFVAWGVLAAGHAPSAALEEDIQQHVRRFLAPYEYPKKIEFIAALPMTTTGKVQRKVLREREASGKPQL